MFLCFYVCMCVFVYVCMCVCVSACIYVCVYVCFVSCFVFGAHLFSLGSCALGLLLSVLKELPLSSHPQQRSCDHGFALMGCPRLW